MFGCISPSIYVLGWLVSFALGKIGITFKLLSAIGV